MRKGILGSIAALAAGAGTAWGQFPGPVMPAGDPPPPAAVAPAGSEVTPAQARGGPNPVIMPPIGPGPSGDPQGLGPVAGFGPPPGPMYPNPGPYGAPMFQPGPPASGGAASGGAPHWWFSGDYLLYFTKAQPINFPLLTTSAPSDFGLLGRGSTLTLVGNKDLSYNPFSGYRVTGGFYGDADRRYGFEASGFMIGENTKSFAYQSGSSGISVLARPFIDSINVRAGSALPIAGPSLGVGRATVDTSSLTFGAEANGLLNLYRSEPGCKSPFSLDLIGGYRYLELDEELAVRSVTQINLPNVTTPVFTTGPFGILTQTGTVTTAGSTGFGGVPVFNQATINVSDSFRVYNRFNGGQLGLRGEGRHGMWSVTVTAKLAIGDMQERLVITGKSSFLDLNRNTSGSAFGGVLANPSNIGVYNNDVFAIIPEGNVNVGLNLTRGLTAFVGYNFLYINKLARPGNQINSIVNTSGVPTSPNYGAAGRPFVVQELFQQSDYWMMGINFGLQLRY